MRIIILLALLWTFSACEQSDSQQENDLQDEAQNDELLSQVLALDRETMEIHDEVMPYTDDMELVQRQLQSIYDRAEGTDRFDPAMENRILEAIAELDEAYFAMMDWMQEYKIYHLQKDRPSEELLEYYTTEREKITEIGRKMKNSLLRGQNLLQELGKK